MNRAVRYIGLYRPWGFKHNVFNLFYTRHPSLHLRKQSEIYGKASEEAFFEIAEMMGIVGPKSISIYSKQPYLDYRKLHTNLLDHYKNRGNEIFSLGGPFSKTGSFIFPGKYVCFKENQLPKSLDIDQIIKEILSKK